MTSDEFIRICRDEVVKYYNGNKDCTDKNEDIEYDNTFVVWYAKELQNHKCLISTTVSDGMYYELTYNGDKNELYFDAYKKWCNKRIEV